MSKLWLTFQTEKLIIIAGMEKFLILINFDRKNASYKNLFTNLGLDYIGDGTSSVSVLRME
jgi:hypothetical protein